MGPNNDEFPVFYMNGDPIGKLASIPEITSDTKPTKERYTLVFDLARPSEFTGEFKLRFPHMSKRKFIRKLMARGYKRNNASELAKISNEIKISYGYAYALIIIGYPLILLRKG